MLLLPSRRYPRASGREGGEEWDRREIDTLAGIVFGGNKSASVAHWPGAAYALVPFGCARVQHWPFGVVEAPLLGTRGQPGWGLDLGAIVVLQMGRRCCLEIPLPLGCTVLQSLGVEVLD